MPKALWNDVVLASSEFTERVEGNHYFPLEAVNMDYLALTERHSYCPWKGEASYYSVEIAGKMLEHAAWTYLEPSEKAANIKGYIAFDRRVTVE
jgi:uncharacterized protein (DUF427 family)